MCIQNLVCVRALSLSIILTRIIFFLLTNVLTECRRQFSLLCFIVLLVE